ncbi:MAG: hypothetical protein ACJAZS_000199 [Alteromonas naphthalenivorans]|jgi:hypothetical protein
MHQELYCISLTIFFFFLDLFFIQIFSHQCLYFLYIFSLITLFKKQTWPFTLFIFFLLAAESTLIYTTLGIDFFAALLSYTFAWFMLDKAASKIWLLLITLISFLLITFHTTILSSQRQLIPCLCTSLRFIGNFVLLYISLKWLSAVKRGNRF